MINGILKILSIIGIIVWFSLTILWLISCVFLFFPLILLVVGELWILLLVIILFPLIGTENTKELMNKLEKK